MKDPRASHSVTLRVNTLAACLAMALGATAVSAGASDQHLPFANQSTTGPNTSATDRPIRNQPNAGWYLPKRETSAQRPAAVLPVTTCSDGGPGSLRDVIGSAGDGDTIDLSQLTCSTITLTGGRINVFQDDLTLSGPGQQNLTIDGSQDQIFNVLGDSITIQGLTIANGVFAYGGCVYTAQDLTLTDSTITGCTAGDVAHPYTYGGGIDVRGDLTMARSTVTGNIADGSSSAFGGGVYVRGIANISDSIISNNFATARGPDGDFNVALGGGLAAIDGLVMANTTVADNRASSLHGHAYGGGIIFLGTVSGTTPTATINRSKITGNVAHSSATWSYGGGIAAGFSGLEAGAPMFLSARSGSVAINYSTVHGNSLSSNCGNCVVTGGGINAFGQITVAHSTVSGNQVISDPDSSVTAYGGGLATRLGADDGAAGTITVLESTISGNRVLGRAGSQGGYGRGGGIAAILSPARIDNSTVTANVASASGGGVMISYANGTSTAIHSSIIAGNEAMMARDIGLFAPFSNGPGIPVLGGHNLILAASANLALPNDTLYADPGLRPLASNGGPTQTHALWPDSPAIDAGSNPNNDACDQRGVPYSRLFGLQVDIGAFEWAGTLSTDVIFRNGFEGIGCQANGPD